MLASLLQLIGATVVGLAGLALLAYGVAWLVAWRTCTRGGLHIVARSP